MPRASPNDVGFNYLDTTYHSDRLRFREYFEVLVSSIRRRLESFRHILVDHAFASNNSQPQEAVIEDQRKLYKSKEGLINARFFAE